jgi:hypothetical protein
VLIASRTPHKLTRSAYTLMVLKRALDHVSLLQRDMFVQQTADSRCKQSKQSKNLQSFFRPSRVCHCETVRWGDGPHRTLRVTCLTHTRLIKTDDFQARSSTALEAAM